MKKIGINLFIMAFSLILLTGFVSSANTITLDLPVQDASISDSYELSASLDTNTLNITSATFYYNDGSSDIVIGTTSNDSATVFNYTWDTTALIDVDDYTIGVNSTNETGTLISLDTSTGVDIDNGNPTASFTSSTFSNGKEANLEESITIGLSADDTIGISSCIVYYTNTVTNEVSSQVVSASGNACSTTTTPSSQSLQKTSRYNIVMEATDGNGDSTNSSARVLKIPSTGGGSQVEISPASNIGTGIKNFINSIIDFFGNLF